MNKQYLFALGIFFFIFHCKKESKTLIASNHIPIENKIDTLEFQPEYINEVSSLGIGVANPKKFSFTLYSDTLRTKSLSIENIEKQKVITPLIYKPDYLLFYLVVKEKTDKWYKIIYNKNKIGYVLSEEFTFYTWEKLLSNTTGVIIKEGYNEKNKATSLQQLSENDTYIIEEIDKEWIYVRKEIEENLLDGRGYWVKWKDENKLNIKPIFLN